MMKETTVVIASSENEAVFDCIESVDNQANVVVSLTPSDEIENRLSRLRIPHVVVPRGNLGVTFNAGIELAETEKVIIMTDDATFNPGAIDKLSEGLERTDACKPKIVFEYEEDSRISRAIAEARDHINSFPFHLFTPGLSINKSVREEIGGHYFNEDVRWAEDAEFSYRYKKNGLSYDYIPDATINHPRVSPKHDLTGAFLIGLSKSRSVSLGLREGDEDIIPTAKRILSGESIRRKRNLQEDKGLTTMVYGLVWDASYNAGYTLHRMGLTRRFEETIWEHFGRGKQGESN